MNRTAALASTALVAAYVLVPNSHHVVLAGAPLSLVGAAALVLTLARPVLRPETGVGRNVVWLLGGALLVKSVVAVALPARGFSGEYFMNDRFAGRSVMHLDRRLEFDAETFRREFFIDLDVHDRHADQLPFSVTWRGAIALAEPAAVRLEVTASEPTTVTIDGEPPGGVLARGTHTVVVAFVRRTTAPPSLKLTMSGPQVFAGAVGPTAARLARAYTAVSVVGDALLLLGLILSVAQRLLAAIRERRGSRLPPFRVVGVLVIAFWFALGAMRAGPRWGTMEFLDPGDDWNHYKGMARNILAGDIGNGTTLTSVGSFAYPYFLAALSGLFGERHWPIYFAQHLVLALACLCFGLVARRIFGEAQGVLALVAVSAVALLDVSRWYVGRFLSENLAILVVPAAFLAVHACLARPRALTAVVAGAMLGSLGLARVSLIPFVGLLVAALVATGMGKTPGGGRIGWRWRLTLVAACALTYGLLPLRDYLVTGALNLYSANSATNYWQHESYFLPRLRVSWLEAVRSVVIPNIAFMLGYPKLITYPELVATSYSLRPHWALLWLVYLAYVVRERRKRPTATEAVVHLFVAVYVGVLVTQPIWSYGFRYVLPLPLVLAVFLPAGLAALWATVRRRRRAPAGETLDDEMARSSRP